MKYSSKVKPISGVKAKVPNCEATQKTLALLMILALGNRQIEQGRVVPAAQALDRVRQRALAKS